MEIEPPMQPDQSSRPGAMWRIGIDLGGTKIEIAAIHRDGRLAERQRVPTPSDYPTAIATMASLIAATEARLGEVCSVGLGIPGCIDKITGVVKNPSANALNGHPLDRDLADILGRAVRVENDANCFALSEAADGAGAGESVVFGVILGTGCGGGLIVNGRVVVGRHQLAGEWGHNPLPWPAAHELPGPYCWCGRHNCLETLISGTGLARSCDGPDARDATQIPIRAANGDAQAHAALQRHADQLARGLAHLINVIDPDVIVLGGGLSNMEHLYTEVPPLLTRHVFGNVCTTPIVPAMHGDSSGVRGAAWLWPVA
jgi:fructokinase